MLQDAKQDPQRPTAVKGAHQNTARHATVENKLCGAAEQRMRRPKGVPEAQDDQSGSRRSKVLASQFSDFHQRFLEGGVNVS
jgi:hypothetical protein